MVSGMWIEQSSSRCVCSKECVVGGGLPDEG